MKLFKYVDVFGYDVDDIDTIICKANDIDEAKNKFRKLATDYDESGVSEIKFDEGGICIID